MVLLLETFLLLYNHLRSIFIMKTEIAESPSRMDQNISVLGFSLFTETLWVQSFSASNPTKALSFSCHFARKQTNNIVVFHRQIFQLRAFSLVSLLDVTNM